MFKRQHHQRIHALLGMFNADLLKKAECYFAGGTALVLLLDEYRESVDVVFLCASKDGYKILRNTITEQSLGNILLQPVKHLRDVRADRDGLRTFLEWDGVPIKVEIVFEARIEITGAYNEKSGVPVLALDDFYAEKLLANCDRGLDRSTANRDVIDLVMLIKHKGSIPQSAWNKAIGAYGKSVVTAFVKSIDMLDDEKYLKGCLQKMAMAVDLANDVLMVLKSEKLPNTHLVLE